MRAFGPGSVSSLLKLALDVVRAALIAIIALTLIAAVAGAFIGADPDLLGPAAARRLRADGLAGAGAAILPGTAAAFGLLTLAVIERLRRIFATLIAGDPFHPDNVRRLRAVGLLLAAVELGRVPAATLIGLFAPRAAPGLSAVNPTAWFAVLVVFVLAEVFREGARLRREAELTI